MPGLRITAEHERSIDADETPSSAVIAAVCAVEGTEAIDLPPLSETIGATEIDTLLESPADPKLCFTYNGYDILVTTDRVWVGTAIEET